MTETTSIFARYYADEPFVDRYASNPDGAVDIIIPVLYTNELWRKNLTSIYREVPVRRILLGDAGCKDDTLVIAREFPRMEILDHSAFKSLGYSIRELIAAVGSEWFLYLHSDVYLPPGWFDTMRGHQSQYDWFGCPMHITALVEYPLVDKVRPYAGAQMGRKQAFIGGLDRIDDDYVYRQEDWVFAGIVEDGGFRHGRIEDTFHWHQMMPRRYSDQQRVRKFKQVRIDVEQTRDEEVYSADTQLRGIIKYLDPVPVHIDSARANLADLYRLGGIDLAEFYRWVVATKPSWLRSLPSPSVPQSDAELLRRRAMEKLLPQAFRSQSSAGAGANLPPSGMTGFINAVVSSLDPAQCPELIPELNKDVAGLKAKGQWDQAAFVRWLKDTSAAWTRCFSADEFAMPAVSTAQRTTGQLMLDGVRNFLVIVALSPLSLAIALMRGVVTILSRVPFIQSRLGFARRVVAEEGFVARYLRALMSERCHAVAAVFETFATRA